MFDPFFDSEAFKLSELKRAREQGLSGLLLLTIRDDVTEDRHYVLLGQETARLILHYKSPHSGLEDVKKIRSQLSYAYALEEDEKKIRSQLSTAHEAFFIGAYHRSLDVVSLESVDEYAINVGIRTHNELSRIVNDVSSHYFFLYALQERFNDSGKIPRTVLDVPEEEILPWLYKFCSKLWGNPVNYAASAELLRSFVPGKAFSSNLDELLKCISGNSRDFLSGAVRQCEIIEAIVKEDYLQAANLHKRYVEDKATAVTSSSLSSSAPSQSLLGQQTHGIQKQI